jgi:predicted NAD-dependent protein-ADP-ribosyltransferase YbiA (DUF1768 family)
MAADSPPAVFPPIDQMAETEGPGVAAEAGAAEAVEEGPTLAERVRALKEPPYDDATLAMMQKFYTARKKNAVHFSYTAGGDLEIKEGATLRKGGKPITPGVTQLKRFLPLEAEERATLEDARLEALAEVEQRYEEAIQRLRDALATYQTAVATGGSSDSEIRAVVGANQRVAELDGERNSLRSALRTVVEIVNPVARDILLDQFYETRKLFREKDAISDKKGGLGRSLYRLAMTDLKPEHFYGKYVPDEAVEAEEEELAEEAGAIRPDEAAYRTKLKDGRIARIFFDIEKSPINDPLSPFWPAKLQLRETEYRSPLQAYEAERCKELGYGPLREAIMKATSARTVRLLITRHFANKEAQHPKNVRGLWMEIYTAVAQQHPEWRAKLLATGTDALIYADPQKGPSGIAVDAASPDALDPSKWTGENVVGLVLETVRTKVREETLAEAPTGEIKEAAITDEQAQANRVGAIINAARRRNGGHVAYP